MAIIESTIHIHATPAAVFALSQDYRLRTAWDPFVRKMRFPDGESEAGLNVRVWVRAWTGLAMEVRFTSFQPPRSVAMTMVRGPWIFQQFAGTWLFHECSNGETEVTFRYFFRMKPGFALLSPIVGWALRRDIRARLRGLKRGVEDLHLASTAACPRSGIG